MHYITEQEIDQITTATGVALNREPKVTVTIRAVDQRTHWEGGINGHFFRIRTDTPVAIPQSLAKLIALSDSVRLEAEAYTRAYRAKGGKKVL